MGNLHAGIAEGEPGQGGGEHDLGAGFRIGVDDGRNQKLAAQPDGLQAAHVAPRIGPLVGRPVGAPRRPVAPGEGHGQVGFEGMGKHVEAGRGDDAGRQAGRGQGVDHRHGRLDGGTADGRLHVVGGQVVDQDGGDLGPGAARGRARDMGLEGPGNRLGPTHRCVDVGEEIVGPGGIQVGRLGRVHDRTAAHRDETVEGTVGGESRRCLQGRIGRFDAARVVHRHVQPGFAKRLESHPGRFDFGDVGFGEERHPFHAQRRGVLAQFGQGPGPEFHGRRRDGEDGLTVLPGGVVGRLTHCGFLM